MHGCWQEANILVAMALTQLARKISGLGDQRVYKHA